MGRQLRRVPLDFEWPMNQVWQGFINPYYKQHCSKCWLCRGDGASREAKKLNDRWYGWTGRSDFRPEDRGSKPFEPTDPYILENIRRKCARDADFYGTSDAAVLQEAQRMCGIWNAAWSHHLNSDDVAALIAKGRLMDLTHTWSRETGWVAKEPAYVPTPEEVNRWSLFGPAHDSINNWTVVAAEAQRLGLNTKCEICEGEGSTWDSPENQKLADEWTQQEPPAGEGYQLWETVSEGSPISPVFATPEGLASWLAGHRQGSIDEGTTFDQWLAFICGPGWSTSMVSTSDGKLVSGVQAASMAADD